MAAEQFQSIVIEPLQRTLPESPTKSTGVRPWSQRRSFSFPRPKHACAILNMLYVRVWASGFTVRAPGFENGVQALCQISKSDLQITGYLSWRKAVCWSPYVAEERHQLRRLRNCSVAVFLIQGSTTACFTGVFAVNAAQSSWHFHASQL